MAITNQRELIAKILLEILEEKGYNNIVLNRELKLSEFDNVQKAFITEVVNGTIRNLIHIDYIINLHSKTHINKMKSLVLAILRSSVYQIKFMDKVPNHAVCNEAVDILKKGNLKGLAPFVNGVLRTIARVEELEYPPKEAGMEIKYSTPIWLIKYLKSFLGLEKTEEVLQNSLLSSSVNIAVNTLKTNKAELDEILTNEGVSVEDKQIKNTGNIAELASFKQGLFHIMDASSQKSVELLAPKPNDRILDLCAAPGGKSFFSSYLMNNTGEVVSCDIHPHKLELIKAGTKRLGITNITTMINDATVYNSQLGVFDKVILDAPCSGFGLIRKKPDIKYTKSFEDIIELAELQKKMLKASTNYVKSDGYLLYSTCTISKKENEDNVAWFIDNFDFELITQVQLLPSFTSDGFFIATFRRKQ